MPFDHAELFTAQVDRSEPGKCCIGQKARRASLDASDQATAPAQHLDSGVRMRLVADPASTAMPIVIDEHEGAEGIPVWRWQGAPQAHVTVIDEALRGQHSRN
jgi:hypothetical protein